MATVSSATRSRTFTAASASAGPYDVNFRIFGTSLAVYVNDVVRTDYTLSAAFVDGYCDTAQITFLTPLAIGNVVTIDSVLPFSRAQDFLSTDPGMTRKMNDEEARQFSIMGDLRRDIDHSPAVPPSWTGARPVLPKPTSGTILIGRSDETGWTTGPTLDSLVTTPSAVVEFTSIAALKAYSALPRLTVGTTVVTRQDNFILTVVSSGEHWSTAGGDKLLVQRQGPQLRAGAFALDDTGATDHAALLTALIAERRGAEFFSGIYRLNSTVAFPTTTPYGGGLFRGAGRAGGGAWGTARSGKSFTAFVWGGTVGGTMFTMDGQVAVQFEHLSWDGRSSGVAVNNAGVGVQVSMTGGFGSAAHVFQNCQFDYMDVAIRCGTAPADTTCSDLRIRDSGANNVGTFLKVENDQGLNYVFDFFSANNCDRIAHFVRGGNLDFRMGNMATCGATNWLFDLAAISDNSYGNSIRNLRVEQNSKRVCKQVGGSITIENLTEAQFDQNVTMFDFAGVNAVIRDSRLVTNDTTNPTIRLDRQSGGFNGHLLLENVYFDVASWVLGDWISRPNVNARTDLTVRGCSYGTNAIAIEDFSTNPAFGPVPLSISTVGATGATNMRIFGASSSNFFSIPVVPLDTVVTYDVNILGVKDDDTVLYTSRRLATFRNLGNVVSLINSQTIGTDVDTIPLATKPEVVAFDAYDGMTVNVFGQAANNINWSAKVREVSRVGI
jgi:hypothetical protein